MVLVSLPDFLLKRLESEARAHLPEEACALLLGTWAGEELQVTDVALSNNTAEGDRTKSFEIDPSLHLMLQKAARAGGPQVVGVWHSHPGGVPVPSDTDRAQSVMPNWLWVITAVGSAGCETRMFIAGDDTTRDLRPLA